MLPRLRSSCLQRCRHSRFPWPGGSAVQRTPTGAVLLSAVRPSLALPCSTAPQPIPRTGGARPLSPGKGQPPPPRWGDIGDFIAEPKVRPAAKKLKGDHGQPSVKYAPASGTMVTRRLLKLSPGKPVPPLAPEPEPEPSKVPSVRPPCAVCPSAAAEPCLPLVP